MVTSSQKSSSLVLRDPSTPRQPHRNPARSRPRLRIARSALHCCIFNGINPTKMEFGRGPPPENGPYPPWVAALGRSALTFDRNGDDRLRQISIVPYSSHAVQGDGFGASS